MPEVSHATVGHLTVTQRSKLEARRDAALSNNARWTRPCVFCGAVGRDDTKHYFQGFPDEPGCPALQRRAWERGDLNTEDQPLSLAWLLGTDSSDNTQQDVLRRLEFLYAIWRQLDDVNKGGTPLHVLSDSE